MKRNYKIFSAILAIVVLVSIVATGCGNRQSTGSSGGTAQGDVSKDTLVVACSDDPGNFDASSMMTLAVADIAHAWVEPLFYLNASGKIEPLLVEKYENVEPLVWNFTLIGGVKFHDGTTLDSEDVKASIERCKTTPSGRLVANIESVEVVDELNFTIKTSVPDAYLDSKLYNIGTCIYPSEKIAEDYDFAKEPVGTGPYKFTKYSTGEELVLEGFADYHQGVPPMKTVTMKFMPEATSRAIALESGDADFDNDVFNSDMSTFLNNDKIGTVEKEFGISNLVLNNDVWPLNNENVRKAIAAAINREDIIKAAEEGIGEPAYACVPKSYFGYTEKNATTYDLEAAKKYLKDSGEDLSGWEFEILCKNSYHSLIAQVIQSNLAEIGINVKVTTMDVATIVSNLDERTFFAYFTDYAAPTTYDYLNDQFYSTSGNNICGCNDEKVDTLLNKISETFDQAEGEKYVEELVEYLNGKTYMVPLNSRIIFKAFDKKLSGIETNLCKFQVSWYDIAWK